MPHSARFTIRAASTLTGINQNTLRAWERRHALLQPGRTPKGYRLYSADDIEQLRLIQCALQEGVSIGRMRSHLEAPVTLGHLQASPTSLPGVPARNARLAEASPTRAGPEGTTALRTPANGKPSGSVTPLTAFAEQIESAARRLDRPALERAFGRAVGIHSLRQAFYHALAPALTRVGQRRLEEPADATCERFLTAFAREKLLNALAGLRPLHRQPYALFACMPGEQHEIALMLLSLEVGLAGVSARYLGRDTPLEVVQQAAAAAGSRAIAVSATAAMPQEAVLDLRDRLARLPRKPRLLIGGPAARKNRRWLDAQDIEVLSLDAREAGAQVLRAIDQAQVRPRD